MFRRNSRFFRNIVHNGNEFAAKPQTMITPEWRQRWPAPRGTLCNKTHSPQCRQQPDLSCTMTRHNLLNHALFAFDYCASVCRSMQAKRQIIVFSWQTTATSGQSGTISQQTWANPLERWWKQVKIRENSGRNMLIEESQILYWYNRFLCKETYRYIKN